jgi:uncharacterized protein YgiM (DUF1202 family)
VSVTIIKRSSLILILIIISLFAADYPTMYCQVSQVNVRSQPNTDSEVLGKLSINDVIQPVDEQGNWFKISYKDQVAWVYKAFFNKAKVQSAKYWYNSKSDENRPAIFC